MASTLAEINMAQDVRTRQFLAEHAIANHSSHSFKHGLAGSERPIRLWFTRAQGSYSEQGHTSTGQQAPTEPGDDEMCHDASEKPDGPSIECGLLVGYYVEGLEILATAREYRTWSNFTAYAENGVDCFPEVELSDPRLQIYRVVVTLNESVVSPNHDINLTVLRTMGESGICTAFHSDLATTKNTFFFPQYRDDDATSFQDRYQASSTKMKEVAKNFFDETPLDTSGPRVNTQDDDLMVGEGGDGEEN